MKMRERRHRRKGKEVESDNKASKRINSEEGCSRRSNDDDDDDVQRLSSTTRIGLFQHGDKEEETNKRTKIEEGSGNGKSVFEYLLEAVSLFSEEEQNSLVNMHASVDDEEEEGDESGELLPKEFQKKIQELNGCEVKFVTKKKLFSTDLNPKHARLSIPPTKIANRFLSQTEESSLEEGIRENGKLVGLSVTVLDPFLKEYKMSLKKWKMEKSNVYNLTKGWNQIVRHNDLQLHQTLQLWSFRVSSQLCFALVKI